MSIKHEYIVRKLSTNEYVEWFTQKHYAKRIPSVSYAYGLYKNKFLVGICSYGRPVAHTLVKYAFAGKFQDNFLELNRLVVDEGLEKNVLSFFVSQTLKQLSTPNVIVSYADTSLNHHGYIYQACNFIYTGLSAKRFDYKVRGLEHLHSASLMDHVGRGLAKGKILKLREMYGDRLYTLNRPRKHRYFYFLGTRKQKQDMRDSLTYTVEPYPKGDNGRYDTYDNINRQGILF
tara:strand:+ start:565 stop:1260 length:696 start_codon:yes stop_codon:yes gene_type:complete